MSKIITISDCWKCPIRCDHANANNDSIPSCEIPARELPAEGIHPDCKLKDERV